MIRTIYNRAQCATRMFSSATRAWPNTAIIGIGQMGAAVATNLLRNNVPLVLYDLEGAKNIPEALRDQLVEATFVSSAREAAEQSEVIITALPEPTHVTAAFSGNDGILAGLQPGSTWIEHSTTDFLNTEKIRNS